MNAEPIGRVVEVSLEKLVTVGQKETRPLAVVLTGGLRVLVVVTPWPAPRPLPYLRVAVCLEAVCLGIEPRSSSPLGPLLETLGLAPVERPELEPSAVAFASGLDEITGSPSL